MTAPVLVDARGLRCPAPVIRLARTARDATRGTTITVLATDPAAVHDVPAWARMRGHVMVASARWSDAEIAEAGLTAAQDSGTVYALTVEVS